MSSVFLCQQGKEERLGMRAYKESQGSTLGKEQEAGAECVRVGKAV